ncbi:unnamed protein product [Arctia plantaginis]|uniref:Asteroid domain-containing protein n=1 Tax=Arctia plantaginis TaxID=874455 RepID=A0A8S0ZHD0_ARCPL|nr:unnamed protein product [Arctia plantaginis]CAB3242732.1 unnamed protein product [Arctia plantaginis]
MRIICFPKLVQSEESKPHTLKNCALVIDGQNFFYSINQDSKPPHLFGIETNEHAKRVRKLLYMFKNSNVECYVVFKGGNTDVEKKITKLKAKLGSQYCPEEVFSVFAKDVCKQVLKEVGVKYATCVFESKEDCVALAQALNCSVLSDDIDFCFKGAPYIPSTTLKYSTQSKQITCKQYHIKDFMQKYSITNKKLAIFAALSDVNVFEHNHFNNLLLKWNVSDRNMYLQIKKKLKWLSEHSEEESLNSILEFLNNEDEKEKFLSQMQNILKSMNENSSSVVAAYLLNRSGNNNDLSVSFRDPQWFEKGVAAQKIPIQYINLYTHKCIIGSWADTKSKNANNVLLFSADIIKYAHNLLTNYKLTEITVYHDGFLKIKTEDKIRKAYKCSESVFENGWKNIRHLKLFEHFLLTNNINTDFVKDIPVEARMLFITLAYFTRKKTQMNLPVTKEVYCFIVSYIIHFASKKKDSPRKKNSKINQNDCVAAILATKKYFTWTPDVIDNVAFNTLYELQYCLLHMNYLNTLCGSPFMTTKYHETFNGTFIYKLLKDMDGGDEKEFIAELFKTAPSVLTFVSKLISTYEKLLKGTD